MFFFFFLQDQYGKYFGLEKNEKYCQSFEGKNVASYQDPMLNQIYHFKESHVRVTPKWLQSKFESIDFLNIMKGWWLEGNFRSNPTHIGWKTSNFIEIIHITVILRSRIFGRKDASHLLDKWIPIIHQVITYELVIQIFS